MPANIYETVLHNIWGKSTSQPTLDGRADLMHFILLKSTHKTYKYILINGLLGAAAQWNNPLVLQAQSSLERPWDARTVCHKVLVPFEREHMEGRLGNSNEPFLNKPARFPELSLDNAVRRGRDKEVLVSMIGLFNSISSKEDAEHLLWAALHFVRQMPAQKVDFVFDKDVADFPSRLQKMLHLNIEGEVLTYCSGLILWSQLDKEKFIFSMHPSNQSGASSKEVADIDIFAKSGDLFACFEIKDKDFSSYDFEHARNKAYSAGVSNFTFISRDRFISSYANKEPDKYAEYINEIISIEQLGITFGYSSANLNKSDIENFSSNFVKCTRPKEETVKLIYETWS